VPGAFQRFMQYVLAEHITAGYCVVYCDDITIFSQIDDPLVHLQHLEAGTEVFARASAPRQGF